MSPNGQRLPTGSDLAALWPAAPASDVRAFLERHPSLRGDRDAVLDLAYDEYCRLVESGGKPDLTAFCARYPTFRSALLRVIQAHDYLDEHPELLEERDGVPWPTAGETFLGFRLLRELGRGAFARVFLAAEPELGDRLVAVKVSPHGAGEAQTLGRLDHPNVVMVHAIRKDERSGLTAVCMPYLGSATLDHVLATFGSGRPQGAHVFIDAARAALGPEVPGSERPTPHPLLLKAPYAEGVSLIGSQLADALAFLHRRDIFHRDLKPSNVLLCPDGRPMLLDFNLSADPRFGRERLGGTLPYMAPEQVQGAFGRSSAVDPVDGQSDLFGLGVILFELLTGRLPFGTLPRGQPGPADCELHLARQQQGAPSLRTLCPEATPALARIVADCLAFDHSHRPASAAVVAAALRRDLSAVRRSFRRLRRHPRLVAAAAILALGLPASGAVYLASRPPYADRMMQQAQAAYAAGDNRLALDRLGLALTARPESADAHFLRGRVYQHQGELGLARDEYAEAYRLAPSGKAAACLAYCLGRTGDHKHAIEWNEEAIANGFQTAEVYNNLGYAELRTGEAPNACANVSRAIKLSPHLSAALHNRLLLVAHELTLDHKEYLTLLRVALDEALANCPDSAELRRDAARVCALAGKLQIESNWNEEALTHLEAGSRLGLPVNARREFATLGKDPRYQSRFQALCQASPPPVVQLSSCYLADPLVEPQP